MALKFKLPEPILCIGGTLLIELLDRLRSRVSPLCLVPDDSIFLTIAILCKTSHVISLFSGLREKGAKYLQAVASENGHSMDRIEVLDKRKKNLTMGDTHQIKDLWRSRRCLQLNEGFDHSVVNATLGGCGNLPPPQESPCLPLFIWQCGENKGLSKIFSVMEFDFSKPTSPCFGKAQVEFTEIGICHGFALWIDWVMDTNNSIAISAGLEPPKSHSSSQPHEAEDLNVQDHADEELFAARIQASHTFDLWDDHSSIHMTLKSLTHWEDAR
ncbi:hypothetical protein Vadar_020207 [Vaccinium darrowii]|uniref:Uncharacterized protein n=1 Tax=Vaccinium darrowii TaxID=229202 RepID=A0ACB7YX13_9ERIC|nr:hypothetical protein Vadar_020207 [Vaccinium darrowii]